MGSSQQVGVEFNHASVQFTVMLLSVAASTVSKTGYQTPRQLNHPLSEVEIKSSLWPGY